MSKYDIYFNGVQKNTINPGLVRSKNISDEQLEVIKELHVQRLSIEEVMKNTDPTNKNQLRSLFKDWTHTQNELQKAWGSEPNAQLHPFWQVPHCICPNHKQGKYQEESIVHHHPECPVHGN